MTLKYLTGVREVIIRRILGIILPFPSLSQWGDFHTCMLFKKEIPSLQQVPSSVEVSIIATGRDSWLGLLDLSTSFVDINLSNEAMISGERSAETDE